MSTSLPLWPAPDPEREARIVSAVAEFLQETPEDPAADPPVYPAAVTQRLRRWLRALLQELSPQGPWPFLSRLAGTSLAAGQDLVDLAGDVDRLLAVYAPRRLAAVSLEEVVGHRQAAAADHLPNAGEPRLYGIEGARRLHLWPAPDRTYPLRVAFCRPLDVRLVPSDWEAWLVDGVLGRYGRHYSGGDLLGEPQDFERRFLAGRRLRRAGSFDPAVHLGPLGAYLAWGGTVTAASAGEADPAVVPLVVPASLAGVGAVTVDTGDYPLEVV